MMPVTPTLRDLFSPSEAASPSTGLRLPPVPAQLASLVTGFEWSGLGERVLDLLDLNVIDILLGGWKKQREVRAQLEASAADPTRTFVVDLAAHTVKSTHKSSIQVRSRGKTLMEVAVPIDVAFEIEAVELTLRAGEVRQIRTGQVMVKGTVKIEKTTVLKRELTTLELPGRIVISTMEQAAPVHASEAPAAVM